MLFNGIFNLVQLLPDVVGGVVIGGRVTLAAWLSTFPDAPIKGGYQATNPGHREDGAQQGHKEV